MIKALQIAAAEDMEQLGAQFSTHCLPGCIITLQGEIGTGKTTWIRGFLRGQGHTGAVNSPTYILVTDYLLDTIQIYHFDLYRLNNLAELDTIGFGDYFDGSSICLIEWPERAGARLPDADLVLHIQYQHTARLVTICSYTEAGNNIARAVFPSE